MQKSFADPPERRAFHRQVLLLSAGHLLCFIDRAKIVGLMPTIRRQIVMGDTAAGWVIGTAFSLGYAASIAGAIAFGRRRPPGDGRVRLAIGIALWALASLATGLAGSVATLIGARIVVGAGQALFIPAAVAMLSADGDAAGGSARGLSQFTASASLGRSAGLLAAAFALSLAVALGLAPAQAWRWVFALTALPNVILLVLVLRRPYRPDSAPATDPAPLAVPSTRLAHVLYLLLVLLPFILIQGLGGWLPTLFAQDRLVGPQVAATWAGGVVLLAGTSSQLSAGWLLHRTERWCERVPAFIMGAMAATVPGIALLGWGPGAASATLGALWANLTLGAATFAALFGWQRLMPAAGRVAANGVFFAIITVVGLGVGPLVTGVLAARGMDLRGALLAMVVAGTAAAALLGTAVQPLYRRHLQP